MAKRQKDEGPQLVPKFVTGFQELGFQVSMHDADKENARIKTGHYQPWSLIEGNLAACLMAVDRPNAWPVEINTTWERDLLRREDREEWTGGSFQGLHDALSGKIDMRPFQKARAELEKTGILAKLQSHLADVSPKRKRRMSEHDGEWNFDRRWDMEAFSSTTRTLAPAQAIEFVANFAISSGTSSQAIDKYGAMVWALSDLIESAGIRTGITYRVALNSIDSGETVGTELRVRIKRPEEYLAPSMVAACFRSNFYRRLAFSFMCMGAESFGLGRCSGLGRPIQEPDPIRFEDGKIIMSPDAPQVSAETIQNVILAAVNRKAVAVA